MTTVKFDKAVKYKGVRYAAHEVFAVANEDVAQLKKVGATVVSADSVTPSQPEPQPKDEAKDDVTQLKQELMEYTVPELTKFAQERGINLQGKTRRADIYNIIVASIV